MGICAVNGTDFNVGLLCLHQFIDDLAKFVCVGELSLGGRACCGWQSGHRAWGEG